MILELGSNNGAQYSMLSCLILQVCFSTSVVQAIQTFWGFVSTMLVRESLKSRYQNLGRLSAVWVNFQVLEVNLFCAPKTIVILLNRCLTLLLNPSFYDVFFGDECTDHSKDSGSNFARVVGGSCG